MNRNLFKFLAASSEIASVSVHHDLRQLSK